MCSPTPSVSLPNNVEMPILGLGTTHSGGYRHEAVVGALKTCGYRLVDTARRYGVEHEIGVAIKDAQIAREELFLCSKLWPVDFGSGVRHAFDASCSKLDTEYLDLYMVHMPIVPRWFGDAKATREQTWRQMELLLDQDAVRAIGVSNYSVEDLEELLETCSVRPHVNQVEFHPWFRPDDVKQFCDDSDILLTGYCPLAKGKFLDDDILMEIAERYGKSPAQVCLRWSIEQNVAVVPKSRDLRRLKQNTEIFDFQLSREDFERLSALASMNKKLLNLDDIHDKFCLPDGYKLKPPLPSLQNCAAASATTKPPIAKLIV